MTAQIALAGLLFVERIVGEVQLPPLPPGSSPASVMPGHHGRFGSLPDEIVDVEARDMPDKVNASWYRMATEYGLFDARREFLLNVYSVGMEGEEDEAAWVRVRLLDSWDLARSNVVVLQSFMSRLFTKRFVPEFTVTSLDGKMMTNTTVWGNGTVSTIAIRPQKKIDTVLAESLALAPWIAAGGGTTWQTTTGFMIGRRDCFRCSGDDRPAGDVGRVGLEPTAKGL
jgi:hypothetical protein